MTLRTFGVLAITLNLVFASGCGGDGEPADDPKGCRDRDGDGGDGFDAATCPLGTDLCDDNPGSTRSECIDTCQGLDQTSCSAGLLRTCQRAASGCLAWSAGITCASGSCASASACAGCTDECAAVGQSCNAGATAVEVCTVDEDGCLTLSEVPCPNGCSAGECTPSGLTEATLLSGDPYFAGLFSTRAYYVVSVDGERYVYLTVVAQSEPSPSDSQVKAGQRYDDSPAPVHLEQLLGPSGSPHSLSLSGLTPDTGYMLHLYVVDTPAPTRYQWVTTSFRTSAPPNVFAQPPVVEPHADGEGLRLDFSSTGVSSTVYVVVVADGAAAPSASQIQSGHDASDDDALGAWQSIGPMSGEIEGLAANTAYDVYYTTNHVSEPDYFEVGKLDVTTTRDETPPTFAPDHPRITAVNGTDSGASFEFEAYAWGEPARAYLVVVADGSAAPTSAQVIAGTDASDAAALASFMSWSGSDWTSSFSSLVPGEYDVYFVLVDEAGNRQANPTQLDMAAAPLSLVDPERTPPHVALGSTDTLTLRVELPHADLLDPTVSVDLSALGGGEAVAMFDDGAHGDGLAGDGAYGFSHALSGSEGEGVYQVTIHATATTHHGHPLLFGTKNTSLEVAVVRAYTVSETAAAYETIVGQAGTTRLAEDFVNTFTLPFDVRFYGITYAANATIHVNTFQGAIGFGGGASHFAIEPGNAAWYLYIDSDSFTPFEVVPSIVACHADHSYKMYAGTDPNYGTGNLDSESGVFWQVDGVAPNRVLTFEWDGNYGYWGAYPYLETGAIHFQVKLFEAAGGPDFVIAWGAMAKDASAYPGHYDDWSLVTVGSATRFNDVYAMDEHDWHLQQKANHRWSFVW